VPAHGAEEPELSHEPGHPVAPNVDPLALGLPPDLLDAVNAVVGFVVDVGDLDVGRLVSQMRWAEGGRVFAA